MTTRERVRAFILQNFYVVDALSLDDAASLRDSGIVDSTGVLEVISFVEDELGVEVASSEIVPTNFDSVSNIAAYVERKRE